MIFDLKSFQTILSMKLEKSAHIDNVVRTVDNRHKHDFFKDLFPFYQFTKWLNKWFATAHYKQLHRNINKTQNIVIFISPKSWK